MSSAKGADDVPQGIRHNWKHSSGMSEIRPDFRDISINFKNYEPTIKKTVLCRFQGDFTVTRRVEASLTYRAFSSFWPLSRSATIKNDLRANPERLILFRGLKHNPNAVALAKQRVIVTRSHH